jgi:ATP-binding cassette, subfamily C (CFTR/MRP), member 1
MGLSDRLFFSWMNKIVFDARKGKLTKENLPLPESQQSKRNFELFQKEWEKEINLNKDGKLPSLIKPLWKIYGKEFMIGGAFKLCWSFLVIMGAFFFVRSLILFVDEKRESPYDSNRAGYLLMCCFFVDACLLG